MSEKILFVDDEQSVLDGFQRTLHRDFTIDTALGGELALETLAKKGPYAVIVSDMRMPGMDGVQLLAKVRERSPDTVRMVVTGHADIASAMQAVNEGYLFRFLAKPCDKETLGKALTAALLQYRLVTAEKELLENTLMGSIKVLTDVLSLANPAAFGRSLRIQKYVQQIVNKLALESPWRFEAAAMLSQLGCIALDPETMEAASCGKPLSPDEQARFNMHPSVARDLLRNIPRLEPIAWMVGEQRSSPVKMEEDGVPQSVASGASVLQLAISYDDLRIRGLSKWEAIAELKKRREFGPQFLEALADVDIAPTAMEKKLVTIAELESGMVLEEEIRTHSGLLLVGKGQEISHAIIVRLRNFQHKKAIGDRFMALVPSHKSVTASSAR